MALSKRNKAALCVLLGIIMVFGIVLMFTPSKPVTYKMILINDTKTDISVHHDSQGNPIITLKPETPP